MTTATTIVEVQDVFKQSGVPEITFVQPVEYNRLIVALRTAGRSVVIEGPSGIGKTTSISKAIAEAGLEDRVLSLSARRRADLELIRELPNHLPLGTVIIDDFHRMDEETKRSLADLMKTLADEGDSSSKLIVLGIPNAGRSLIAFGKDLGNRIEVIPFEANPEFKIAELIKKGEAALNININIREEIIEASQGSFYIAQMLAYHTCLRASVFRTMDSLTKTEASYEAIKAHVMEILDRSFRDTTLAFARGSRFRREGRAPYLHLLYWLSQSKNWTINTDREADRHPEQKGSVSQVVAKGYLADLIATSDDIQKVIHFEAAEPTLVVQDPQFIFYLRNLSWKALADEVGFITMEFQSRYDFALSFAGSDRSIAEAIFEGLSDNDMEVFYDRNEQHRLLAEDVEEYLAPIYSSDAALVICILGKDYPTRIWTRFESQHFRDRFKTGEVIPIVFRDAPLGAFDSALKIGHIGWDRSGDFQKQVEDAVALLVSKCGEMRRRKREQG